MSLSPFYSFQSRFVTYLLNFPRNSAVLLAVLMIRGYIRSDNLLIFGQMLAYKFQLPCHSFQRDSSTVF